MCLNVAVKLCIKIIYDTKMQSKKEEAHELHKSKQRTNERTKEWKKECSGSKLVKKNR